MSPALPALGADAGFSVEDRSKEILSHLSAVIRYFRTATQPLQRVGEPSDTLYREQAVTQAGEVAAFAFQSARGEATLLDAYAKHQTSPAAPNPSEGESQRMQASRARIAQRLAGLKAQQLALDQQLSRARPKDIPALTQQRDDTAGALELTNAMAEALSKITGMSETDSREGLAGDIDRLQRSAPELGSQAKTVPPSLASLDSERSAGVSSQAVVLFQLLGTRRSLDQLRDANTDLHTEAEALRAPLTKILRSTIQLGDALSEPAALPQPAASPSPASPATRPAASSPAAAEPLQTAAGTRKKFDQVTATFKALSAAAIPLSQEIILLEQSRANLLAWRTAVDLEYREVLRALLIRVFSIALALGIILGLGNLWKRATARYVRDPRRRRQIMALRRLVIGFLSGLVLIFGFVTQFNSLTTFAGFITAGLAVGLQTILLSVAAYFFIIGRYGVRVGDRISVAGVSGDVIDVGLVRFYLMELGGSGTDLHPTGRVAVFSNAILFQAGTPLYKQMPGTEYAWHELTAKLLMNADYNAAAEAMLKTVEKIYNTYKPKIEAQHRQLESWMDSSLDQPDIESRIQLVDGGLQLVVRFPVEIKDAADVDGKVAQAVLALMTDNERVKSAVTETPAIRAAMKG